MIQKIIERWPGKFESAEAKNFASDAVRALTLATVFVFVCAAMVGASPLRPRSAAQTQKAAVYVGYYNPFQVQYWVAEYARDGEQLVNLGPFKGTPLVATSRSGQVFIADIGAQSVFVYAAGQTQPEGSFALQDANPEAVAGQLTIDTVGNLWLAVGCSGMYCDTPGSLTEYSSTGGVERTFTQCNVLHDYRNITVDEHGNAFVYGVTHAVVYSWRDALVEFPAGSISCTKIRGYRWREGLDGGAFATRSGLLVISHSTGSVTQLTAYGPPLYHHALATTSLEAETGWFSLTRDGKAVWTVGAADEESTIGLFAYPSGGRALTIFPLGEKIIPYSIAAAG